MFCRKHEIIALLFELNFKKTKQIQMKETKRVFDFPELKRKQARITEYCLTAPVKT